MNKARINKEKQSNQLIQTMNSNESLHLKSHTPDTKQ